MTQLLVIIGVIYLSHDIPPTMRKILGLGALGCASVIGLMK
jgi:hypothetical protein